ncbi:MAG: hypothetical protein AB7D51_01835 [Desulfovibrionaceae bacterium]
MNRARRVLAWSWGLSLVLHVLAPLLLVLWTTGTLAALLPGEELDLSTLDLSNLAPPEYLAEPGAVEISDRSVLLDHGGRDEAERELFAAFAESGGLVGDQTHWTEGPKVRFGHEVIARYFSYYRSGFVGHYQTDDGLDVYVLDGTNDPRFGKLLLHVPAMNFLRGLTQRGSRYIYTYADEPLAEAPVEGSIMFMGDGDEIYRLMWIPKHGKALYPTRLMYFPEEWEGAKSRRAADGQ